MGISIPRQSKAVAGPAATILPQTQLERGNECPAGKETEDGSVTLLDPAQDEHPLTY